MEVSKIESLFTKWNSNFIILSDKHLVDSRNVEFKGLKHVHIGISKTQINYEYKQNNDT